MLGFPRFIPVLVLAGTVTALWAAPNESAPAATGSAAEPVAASSLSKDDMKQHAATMKSDADTALHEVSTLRTRAQKQKDVIKLNCVNDKLVQLKAQMNVADKQQEVLVAAMERPDDERASAYTELSVTGENIRRLREEANTCMGESELYKQESGVQVEHPEIVDDPTLIDPYQVDPTLEVEAPGYASPFR